MIDYKNLTDDELLDIVDKLDSKELIELKNNDPDFKMRLINLAKKEVDHLKSLYFPIIEHLEKAISDDRVPENIKVDLKLKIDKYKSWQKNLS
jgi:hypothetical protein